MLCRNLCLFSAHVSDIHAFSKKITIQEKEQLIFKSDTCTVDKNFNRSVIHLTQCLHLHIVSMAIIILFATDIRIEIFGDKL